jgi:hypothetical protein
MPAKSTPKFALVYDNGKTPKSLHTDTRCWSTIKFRNATTEELESLPHCKHCEQRVARNAAKVEESARPTIPARKPAKPAAAENAQVTA